MSQGDFLVEKTIGHYEIAEQIGAGGMGEVYRARDTQLGRDVALKLIPAELAGDAERLSRFEREARLLASLNHPNVAVVHGLENIDGVRLLVMELIPGDDLSVRIDQGPMPVDEALDVMRQVAEGLAAAHDHGIFHRDLKPANIKVTPEGTAKVLDFGLAKADPTSTGVIDFSTSPTITHDPTAAGVILGTAAYMSPEQARGKPADRRADVWAFGVVFFELLTGKRLFAGETVSDTLAAVLRAEPEWESLPSDTPPAIKRLLRRCLERNVRKRLQDISEARIAIENAMSGEPDEFDVAVAEAVASGGTGTGVGAWGFSKRMFLVTTFLAVIAAFALGQLADRIRGGGDAQAPMPVLKSEFQTKDGIFVSPEFSPDGSRFLYPDDGRLWIRDLGRYKAQPIPGTEGMIRGAFSPDGRHIVTTDGTYLYRMPSEGGQKTKLANLPQTMHREAGGIVWTADDRLIFVLGNSGLYWMPASGGDPQEYMAIEEGYEDYHGLTPLPDGKGLLYVIHKPKVFNTIGLCVDGMGRELLTEAGDIGNPAYSPTGHILYTRLFGTLGIWAVPLSLDRLEVTGEPFLVVPDAAAPAVSRRGTLVHRPLQQDVATHLVWMTREGVAIDTIAATERTRGLQVTVSPDGRRLLTSEAENDNFDLWVYDLSGGTPQRLTTDPANDGSVAWSPDGRSVVYVNGNLIGELEIRIRATDGRGEPRVLGEGGTPSFSPDGNWIIFEKYGKNFIPDIYYMPADGSAGPKLLVEAAERIATNAQFSPNGQYVVYEIADAGSQIHLVSFPDGENSWQVTVDGGANPRWAANSDRVFYTNDGAIMEVTIETSPTVRIGTPRVVVPADPANPGWVWPSPDGERILLQKAIDPEAARPTMRIVEHWFGEFGG